MCLLKCCDLFRFNSGGSGDVIYQLWSVAHLYIRLWLFVHIAKTSPSVWWSIQSELYLDQDSDKERTVCDITFPI
jgi:hypothetical protein